MYSINFKLFLEISNHIFISPPSHKRHFQRILLSSILPLFSAFHFYADWDEILSSLKMIQGTEHESLNKKCLKIYRWIWIQTKQVSKSGLFFQINSFLSVRKKRHWTPACFAFFGGKIIRKNFSQFGEGLKKRFLNSVRQKTNWIHFLPFLTIFGDNFWRFCSHFDEISLIY